jgi:hypothetical protein
MKTNLPLDPSRVLRVQRTSGASIATSLPVAWMAGCSIVLSAGLALVHGDARADIGTPQFAKVAPDSPSTMRVEMGRACSGNAFLLENCRLEASVWKNGQLVSPREKSWIDAQLSGLRDGGLGFGTFVLRGLQPGSEYCFEFWARDVSSGTRSDEPTARACGKLTYFPPRAPAGVTVGHVATQLVGGAPRITWNAPDQSDYRPVERYTLEHLAAPTPNVWLKEGEIAGPNGAPATQPYTLVAKSADTTRRNFYRVCAINSGGTTCSEQAFLDTTLATDPARVAANASGVAMGGNVQGRAPAAVVAAAGNANFQTSASSAFQTASAPPPPDPKSQLSANPATKAPAPPQWGTFGSAQAGNPQPLPPKQVVNAAAMRAPASAFH